MKLAKIKNSITYWITILIGRLTRASIDASIKRFILTKIYYPYCAWRKFDVEGETFFGATMHLSLADALQTNIFLSGYWEPAITKIIEKTLSKDDIFIDIGANIGYYTLLASELVGKKGKVYAFEASPKIYNQLQRNISKNGINNTNLFNAAISNHTGSTWIWSAPEGNAGHSTIMDNVAAQDGHTREAEVPCGTIEQFVPKIDLTSARLIKIDIEGAERLAIEGILQYFAEFSNQTEWIIELSPNCAPGGMKDIDWIFSTFITAGFKAYRIYNSYSNMLDDSLSPSTYQLDIIKSPPTDLVYDVFFSKTEFTSDHLQKQSG